MYTNVVGHIANPHKAHLGFANAKSQRRKPSELAKSSLEFYNVNDISKIEKVNIPYNVTEVRYKSNLSEIEPIPRDELKQYGKFYESI